MRRVPAALAALAVIALVVPTLAQGAGSTLSVSPSTVQHRRAVILSGTGWGANIGGTVCNRMRVTAKGATGPTRLFSAPIVGPPNTTFRLRVLVRLSPGTYTLTATQSCSGPDGAGAGQATTELTVT